jgi:hypothetical protein
MVLAQPCHSGGLVAPILDASPAAQTTVAAACGELRSSKAGDYASPFSPFSKAWISAMAGVEPDGKTSPVGGDPDGDRNGLVSASEAFEYARRMHSGDDPQYGHFPSSADTMNLTGRSNNRRGGTPGPVRIGE